MSGTEVYLLPMITSGGETMIKGDLWHEIHSRFKLKEAKKAIAGSLGLDVRTVCKILRQQELQTYKRSVSGETVLSREQ